MPRSERWKFAQLYAIARGLTMPLITTSAAAVELIDFAGREFDVSRLAARIRMLKLRLLID
jgi:hypothetical protein